MVELSRANSTTRRSEQSQILQMPCVSRDFHYALSPEEFNAIMFRIEAGSQRLAVQHAQSVHALRPLRCRADAQSRLASNGTTIGQA